MKNTFDEIPVMKPQLIKFAMVSRYLKQMDDSKIYSNRGPLVTSLERRFAEFFDVSVDQVATCSNATLGIQGAVSVASASHFYVPAYTFPATILSLIHSGKNFEILDIQSLNWQIDARGVQAGPGKGVLCVLPFGAKDDINLYSQYESVVFDAAASIFQYKSSLRTMKSNTTFVFSLHATKVLGIGEGSIVVFGNKDSSEAFRKWTNFGFDGSRNSASLGTNAKMSEIAAAYGLATLDNFDAEYAEWLEQRKLANSSNRRLGLSSPSFLVETISPYRIVNFPSKEIKSHVVRHLDSRKIASRDWWEGGCHRMKAFSRFISTDYPITEQVAGASLGLPLFRSMTSTQVERVEKVIQQALSCKDSFCLNAETINN